MIYSHVCQGCNNIFNDFVSHSDDDNLEIWYKFNEIDNFICPYCWALEDSFYAVESSISYKSPYSPTKEEELRTLDIIYNNKNDSILINLDKFKKIEDDKPIILVILDNEWDLIFKKEFLESKENIKNNFWDIEIEDIYDEVFVFTYFKNSWWWGNKK